MAHEEMRYALGLDSSTQSLTAVVVDYRDGTVAYERSLDYVRDERLNGYGIDHREYLCPPRTTGEADQPPLMFLASLDALFEEMRRDSFPLGRIGVVNVSGQQHGHVYLGADAAALFARLREPASASRPLAAQLARAFAYGTSPIWRTSNTARQAERLRKGVGGKERMIELSGSDSPLRFTGAVMRRVAEQFPEAFRSTAVVQLISSFLPAVLSGNDRTPIDFGNASGMSLMDYRRRAWSEELLAAATEGLDGGASLFSERLPSLAAPDTLVGSIAAYFVERYGFDPGCRVAAGSGDNPQTKVLVPGDLLSLGTSFVFMVSTDGETVDPEGYANAMYDGIGRPFMFGCRTNGAMVWDRVRGNHGLEKKDYAAAERALEATGPGSTLFLWQPENESFPESPAFDERRLGYDEPSLAGDYSGIIDSTLSAVYWYSRHFSTAGAQPGPRPAASADGGQSSEPLYVTGGATDSGEIMRRVSALWRRPVVTIGRVGAALGSAVAGVSALRKAEGRETGVEELCRSLLPGAEPVRPRDADIAAYHGAEGYLRRFTTEYERLFRRG